MLQAGLTAVPVYDDSTLKAEVTGLHAVVSAQQAAAGERFVAMQAAAEAATAELAASKQEQAAALAALAPVAELHKLQLVVENQEAAAAATSQGLAALQEQLAAACTAQEEAGKQAATAVARLEATVCGLAGVGAVEELRCWTDGQLAALAADVAAIKAAAEQQQTAIAAAAEQQQAATAALLREEARSASQLAELSAEVAACRAAGAQAAAAAEAVAALQLLTADAQKAVQQVQESQQSTGNKVAALAATVSAAASSREGQHAAAAEQIAALQLTAVQAAERLAAVEGAIPELAAVADVEELRSSVAMAEQAARQAQQRAEQVGNGTQGCVLNARPCLPPGWGGCHLRACSACNPTAACPSALELRCQTSTCINRHPCLQAITGSAAAALAQEAVRPLERQLAAAAEAQAAQAAALREQQFNAASGEALARLELRVDGLAAGHSSLHDTVADMRASAQAVAAAVARGTAGVAAAGPSAFAWPASAGSPAAPAFADRCGGQATPAPSLRLQLGLLGASGGIPGAALGELRQAARLACAARHSVQHMQLGAPSEACQPRTWQAHSLGQTPRLKTTAINVLVPCLCTEASSSFPPPRQPPSRYRHARCLPMMARSRRRRPLARRAQQAQQRPQRRCTPAWLRRPSRSRDWRAWCRGRRSASTR